jgi:hypothetical protein
MSFSCENCNKIFSTKQNLENHLNRKIKCSPETTQRLENKKFECQYCQSKFTQKQNLKRHLLNGFCTGLTNYVNTTIKEDLKAKKEDKILNINTGTINNSSKITQNIQNTQNIQILVNPFGKESSIKIPDSLYFEAIKNLVKGIPLLIKYVHYNPKFPQNQNIKGKGLCSKYIEVHDGEDWKVDSKKNIIHNLITDKKDKLDDFVDEQIEKNKISKSLAYRYEKQTEKLDEVLNEDFRKEKASDESINLFKELEEEVNMTIENEKNKAKKKKKLD